MDWCGGYPATLVLCRGDRLAAFSCKSDNDDYFGAQRMGIQTAG